jgi:glycosyltransferase involved in cell wall biosynthesis
MPTLLMLAFEFPPMSGVGMLRSLALARHLPAAGVTPVVVSTDADSLAAWFGRPLDAAPLQSLPPGVVIHRVPCPVPSLPPGLAARRLRKLWSLDDEDIGKHWEPRLTAIWDRLVADSKPDALYVSLPPFSVASVAVTLAKRSGLPLILDFRDAWSQWCNSPRLSWLHYQLLLGRERQALAAAAVVIATTRQITLELQRVHPTIPREKFHVVPNGYDAVLPEMQPRRTGTAPFVIGYVGSFYYLPELRSAIAEPWWRRPLRQWLLYSPRREDWLYRTPYFFFRALQRLLERRPDLRARVRVRFAGEPANWLPAQIEEFGLQDVVEHLGRLPHAASLAFQSQCDALLATSAKTIDGRDQFVAGKTFEYVTAGRPIVAFVTEGEQKDFLQQSGIAAMCNPDDSVDAAAMLERVITGAFEPEQNRPFLQRFHRRESGRQMAEAISTVWASRSLG